LSLQRLIIRCVHFEENLFAGGLGIVFFGLRVEFGAAGQVCSSAEIGDELANGQAFGISFEDARIIQTANRRKASILAGCSDGDNAAVDIWKKGGTGFTCDLAGGKRAEISDADTRMILERGFVGLRKGERRRLILGTKIEDEDEDEEEDEWERPNPESGFRGLNIEL
jgi:hypothetical protein